MQKTIYFLISIFISISIYASSNSEIASTMSPVGKGEDFSWEPLNTTNRDMTREISYRSNKILKESIALLDKKFSGSRDESTFKLDEPMAVSISVISKRGTSIKLIDRMAGVLSHSGSVGKNDGRIDLFLDSGEYKIISECDEKEPVRLLAKSFKNVNRSEDRDFFLNSLPGEYLNTSLKDMEQRDFWVYIGNDDPLIMEIMGRNLKYCTLWKEGKWRIDTTFINSKREIVDGQPMNFFEYNSVLPQGYYLIKCIGGVEIPWSTEKPGEQNPFYIRKGMETIYPGELRPVKVSPFGSDAYLYKNADLFVASPAEKGFISLNSTKYIKGRSRFIQGDTKNFTEEDDLCILKTSFNKDTERSIVVSAPAGTILNLGVFKSSSSTSLAIKSKNYSTKRYWINGFIPDSGNSKLDMTPLLADNRKWVQKSGFINISNDKPFARKNNLFSSTNYFIYIEDKITLCIEELGDKTNAKAEFIFTNFRDLNDYEYKPEKYKTGDSVTLKAGFYILDINPIKKGIHHFAIFPRPFGIVTAAKAKEKANAYENIYPGGDISSFNWPEVTLSHNNKSHFQLLMNTQSSKVINIRELPMEIDKEFLTVVLSPGEAVPLEIKVRGNSRMIINGENYKVMNSSNSPVGLLKEGIHQITLTNTGNNRQIYSVGTGELDKTLNIKSPVLKDLKDLLPILSGGNPSFNDYKRSESRQFLLRVDKPGLYRLETTGRLRMSLKVRTPNITSLYNESENGVGRNALINTFLKPGYYLVETETIGKSKGRAGLLLNENPLTNAEELHIGSVSRRNVNAGEAIKYPIEIKKEGEYLFSTLLLGSKSRLRLEDSDGWPLYISENPRESLKEFLHPGKYYYYSLPGPYDSRRVSALDIVDKTVNSDSMPLNGRVNSTWKENGNRIPDKYSFLLTADHSGSITIPEGFEAWIENFEEKEVVKAEDELLKYSLNKGKYTFNIRTIDIDNNKKYTFRTHTNEISADTEKELNYPGNHTVSIGEDSLVDIWSMGKKDVKAELYKGSTLIAGSDDEPGDWNFFISGKLKKGKYTLNISSNNQQSDRVPVFVKERSSIEREPVKLPYSENIKLESQVLSIPLKTGRTAETVSVTTESNTDIYLNIYKDDKRIAQGINNLHIPLKGEDYTLTVYHRSPKTTDIKVTIAKPDTTTADFNNELNIQTSSAVLNNKEQLNYYIEAGEEVLYSPGYDVPLRPIETYSETTFNKRGYLINPSGKIGIVKTRELRLKDRKGEAVNIEATPLRFNFSTNRDQITLVKAVSQGSILGLMMDREDDSASWKDSAITSNYTVMPVLEPGNYTGRLWNPASENIKGALISESYDIEENITLSGSDSFNIGSKTAVALKTVKDSDGYEIVISRGVAASIWSKGLPVKAYDAVNEDLILSIPPGDYKVGLVNYSTAEGLVRVSPGSDSTLQHNISSKKYFENYFTKDGVIEFDIDNIDTKLKLHISGNINSAEFREDSGKYIKYSESMKRGITTLTPTAGTLKLKYSKGMLRVWISTTDDKDMHFATGNQGAGLKDLLPGANKLKGKISGWKLKIDKPGYIKLSTISGGITSLIQNGKLLEYSNGLYPDGRDLYYYLERGDYYVYSRAFNDDKQSGDIIYTFSEATELPDGGLDEELFITQGESHIYTFTVLNKGKIGVGVENNMDYLDVTLFDKEFKELDSGSILFNNLNKGRYYMIVSSPDKTVRYRPVVHGLPGSRQDIPADIIKKYK